MFLLLPLVLAGWCSYKKDTRFVPVIFLGLLAGVLVCGFKAFFLYSHRIIPYSFGDNFLYLLIHQIVLPLFILYGIFCLWSKDSFVFKSEAFGPLILSFYTLYLPFTIISTADQVYTSFTILIKPALFSVMIMIIAFSLQQIERTFTLKKYAFTALWGLISILIICIPPVIESMYILDMNYILILLLSLLYAAIYVLLLVLNHKKITA